MIVVRQSRRRHYIVREKRLRPTVRHHTQFNTPVERD
jgi:hypothetical protein